MRKRILCFLCALVLCLGIAGRVSADSGLDPERLCTLNLNYSRNGSGFENLRIDLYRVAELTGEGEMVLLAPFSEYPIRIHGITSQQEWLDTAQTICSYVLADALQPYRSAVTDENGTASYTGLETGLYMVRGVTARDSGGSVIYHDFMLYLPAPAEEGYCYDVTAKPKYTEYHAPVNYTVIKLWNDADSTARRPDGIEVEILRDGAVQERVVLSQENQWSYAWEAEDDGAVWSVVERNVPAGYQVTIGKNETAFVITNSAEPEEPDPSNPPDRPDVPGTGDTAPVLLYLLVMAISGFGMMLLGILWLRDRNHEKKR